MNRKHLFIGQCLVALICLSEACNNDTDMAEENPAKTVSFIPSVGRATDTQFETGDAISVFASTTKTFSGSDLYADNVSYSYLNTQFIASGTGIEKPESKGLFYAAVYPYSANYNSTPFTFSVKENQAATNSYTLSDLMTATTEAATTDKQIPLKFSHRLSKVVIEMNGADVPSGNMTLSLTNAFIHANVDINEQTFTATGTKGTVTMADNGTNSKKAILPPQEFTKGSTLCKLAVGNIEYDVTLQDNVTLHSGMEKSLYLKKDGNSFIVSTTQGGGNTGGDETHYDITGKWIEDTGYQSQENFAYEFRADGTMDWFSYNKNTLEEKASGTFVISGNQLIIKTSGETGIMEIISATESTLVLAGPEGDRFYLTRVQTIGPDIPSQGNTFLVKSIRGINDTDIDCDMDLTYNSDGSIKTIRRVEGETMGSEISVDTYLSRLNVKRNDQGYITYFDDKYYEGDDYTSFSYEYDSEEHITRWLIDGEWAYNRSYTYVNGNVQQGGDSSVETYIWSDTENKANLDFNHLCLQIFERDSEYHFGLLGMLGKKNKNLCSRYQRHGKYYDITYTYYDNGCVHTVTNGGNGECFEITYY